MKFFFKTYNLYKTVHFGYKAASQDGPPIDMNVPNQHHHSHFIKIYKLATSVFLPIPYYQQVSESTTICAAVFVK